MTYLTDNATTHPDNDTLKFEDFRAALKEIILTAQTPLTIGIFGAWGSGKTSLMRQLRTEIEADGLASRRTVWFTAWKYDQQDALWRSLILRVLDALYPREPGQGPRESRPLLEAEAGSPEERLIQLLNRLEESVYQAVDWEEIGPRAINWWQFVGSTGKAGVETAAALGTLGLFPQLKKLAGGDDTPADDIKKAAQAISRETKSYHRRQLFHLEEFESLFQEAISLITPDDSGRLIVFVDDLDRCLPEKAIEVLEAIKLFLEAPGVVFVLGMDKEVVQRGIEARYGAFFHQQPDRASELPISGDSYLQKIVQIPFHLPALVPDDLDAFIAGQAKTMPEMARLVLARGVYPNPRQVKRALNIYRLLRTIADNRFGKESDQIADPLLVKTVLIQTQFPDLYQLWRQYPTVVQTLEAEYERRVVSEDEMLTGRGQMRPSSGRVSEGAAGKAGEGDDAPETTAATTGRGKGLLSDYLDDRIKYARLARLLVYPPADEAGEGRRRTRFSGLNREQLAAYVRLAGAVESEEAAPVDVPADLMTELLSGERVKIQDAVSRLNSEEPEPDGAKRRAVQTQLVQVLQDPAQPTIARLSAGDALAELGDPRFYGPDGHFLPRDEMLGFVEIPAGNFRMGSDPKKDPQARDGEQPQHTLHLPAFWLARYPVTVAQFRAFVEASGYEPNRSNSLDGVANHPVNWVTWHDAMAYCRWLDGLLREWEKTPAELKKLLKNGHQVILPSEAEWEKAARGSGDSIYPWGGEIDPDKANYKETGRGGPSAVGCFPAGASPFGLLDMGGNVYEWTRNLWGEWDSKKSNWKLEYKCEYDARDGREDIEKGDEWGRVLRGGSYSSEPQWLRCAFRDLWYPSDRFDNLGFRVCVSPFSLPSGR